MSKTRVFIYGSCVSRDTFEHLDPDQFELVEYVARQSVLSATTRPVETLAPPTLTSRFQQRMVTGDFQSSLRPLLATHGSATDLVLVDLTDERLGAYLLPDGSMVTRSVELIESGGERDLPEGTQHIAFGTQQHFEYWTTAMKHIGEQMRTQMPQATIVLLDIPWAEWSETGQATPDSFGVTAAKANPVFRLYVEVATQALKAHVVSLDPAQVMSGPHHPWGEAPFHYSEDVYLDVVHRVTGAKGRTVWGPAADDGRPSLRPTSQELSLTESHTDDGSRFNGAVPRNEILSQTWRFTGVEGEKAVEPLQFRPDGSIWGGTKSDKTWNITDGQFVIDGADKMPYAQFDTPVRTSTGLCLRSAHHPERVGNSLSLETIGLDGDDHPRPTNTTRRLLAREIRRYKWNVGDHSYGKPEIRAIGLAHLEIGKFCWDRFQCDGTSRQALPQRDKPLFFLSEPHELALRRPVQTCAGDRRASCDRQRCISEGAKILSGVTIGDGAYIAPGAVVMSDVPPCAIVQGNPAVISRLRFNQSQVDALLKIQWWEWPDDQIDSYLPLMGE